MGAVKAVGILAFLAAIAALIASHPWGVLYGLGVHPYPESSSTPWTYQLWSGFIPALAIVSLFGGLTAHFRGLNCHVRGCWRIGRFPMAGGEFKVCKPHSQHPEIITQEYVLFRHEEHKACTASSPSSSPASSSTCCSGSCSEQSSTSESGTAFTSRPPQRPQ